MVCNVKECAKSEDCGLLDIFKKMPKDKYSCSYFRKPVVNIEPTEEKK